MIEGGGAGGGDGFRQAMVDRRRGEVADSAVPVVEVVPVEKGPSKGPGILDAPEPIRDRRICDGSFGCQKPGPWRGYCGQ